MSYPSDEDPLLPPIDLNEQVLSIAFHPFSDIIAASEISGEINVFNYNINKHERLFQFKHHEESCRALLFSIDGNALFSASIDKSISKIDLSTGKLIYQYQDSHIHPIYCIQHYNDILTATGDDEGIIKIWDTRSNTPSFKFELDEHQDYVSSILGVPEENILLATSGDGCLTTWDMRKGDLMVASEQIEDELVSIALLKFGKRIVCGTEEGVLAIFNWGEFGDVSDRYTGHPNSVDAMLKVDEETIVTGSSDGMIRLVSIQPNKFLGILGDHDDMPIERLAFSRDKQWLASCSHDSTVKFWNASELFEADEETVENAEILDDSKDEMEVEALDSDNDKWSDSDSDALKKKNKKKKSKSKKNPPQKKNNFFSGL